MFALLTCVAALLGAGATVASAGEVNPPHGYIAGQDSAPLNGNSDCAYSGLNDNYVFGNPLPDADGFTRTQSWGQLDQGTREFLRSVDGDPGHACNPTGGH